MIWNILGDGLSDMDNRDSAILAMLSPPVATIIYIPR